MHPDVGSTAAAGTALARSLRIQTHGFRVLLATLLISLAALPWATQSPGARVLAALVPSASLAAALYAASATPWLLGVGALLYVASLLGWWQDVLGLPPALGSAGLLCGTLLFAAAAMMLWRPVFASRRISEDTLVGSVCIYLLLCLAFANSYLLAWKLAPASFVLAAPSDVPFADFLYFSLVTLTTLGYGDVVPLGAGVRSLVVLESVLGILYPAIAVARLVSLHAAGAGTRLQVATPPPRQRGLHGLLVLVAALVVARPILGGIPLAGVTTLVDATLVVAVLCAMRGRPRRLAVGPAVAALLAIGWAALAAGGPGPPLAFALQFLFYAVALGALALRALRERGVTRDMLLGACCAYLLLGLAFEHAFALLERLAPGSIALTGAQPVPAELAYFSFMTLTTTGFGDILPVGSTAHLLAGLEAALGIFFAIILVARLVALYGTERAPQPYVRRQTPR